MNSLSRRVVERSFAEDGSLFALNMKTPDVVTIVGSVFGGWNYLPRAHSELPVLAAELYDAGTRKHSKKELREALSSRGASVSFSDGGERTTFSASCLPEDLSFVLSVIAECLREPLLSSAELEAVRTRILSDLKDEKSNPNTQARNAFRRLLYEETHVNYAETDIARERYLQAADRAALASYHKACIGRGGLVLAITGDVSPAHTLDIAEKAFNSLPRGTKGPSPKRMNAKAQGSGEKRVFIPKKTSIDMFLGASIPLFQDDPNYVPVGTLANMLGGTFSAHLMQTVRERDGLTYGIRAGLDGLAPDTDGCFYIWSTFAPELFEKGVEATRRETKKFFAHELTRSNLEKKKQEIAGSYMIRLSTTNGMAGELHSLGTRGKHKTYLDEYLSAVRALTVKDIKKAAELIPLSKLSLAAAGTFAK